MSDPSTAVLEARYRRRAAALGKIIKWPAIGALIGGGAMLVGHLFGPSMAEQLGVNAGEGFAHGVAKAQDEITALKQRFSISGWGTYK